MSRIDIPDILKYGQQGTQHDRVLKAILARYEIAQREMAQRHAVWQRADEDYRAYTPESSEDSARKAERSKGILHYTTITVPISYAMLLTAHTYWCSIFLNRNPIFQLMSRKAAVEHSAQAMEAIIDYNVFVGEMLAPYFIWLLDPGRYGWGVIRTYWDNEVKRVAQLFQIENPPDPETGLAVPGRMYFDKQTREIPGYRGNRCYNVRPYNWFPDPRVPLVDFQKGEFCGDTTYRSFSSLKKDGRYINMSALEDVRKNKMYSGRQDSSGSERIQLPAVDASLAESGLGDRGSVHILEMVVNIVPEQWKLGEEGLPEKWLFTVADELVIIGAEPFGHIHDRYPYDLLMYEVEGYALDVRGMLEIGKDFNTTQSWLLNSHMFNVRRALNDMLVIDPSRVNINDILVGGPGKIIRAKPQAYGTPMRDAVHQLEIVDITRSNIADTQLLGELAQQVLGVNQNVMGALDQGGRKTATEIRSANTFSISRLKTIAEWFGATGFAPHAQKLIQNIQQFYFANGAAGPEVYKIVGDFAEDFSTVPVTPDSIAGSFDYVPVDGTLPIDRMAQAGIFKELLQAMMSMPQMAAAYNIDGMINWIARIVGVRNLKQFRIQVVPDQMAAQQAKAGNIVPMGRA